MIFNQVFQVQQQFQLCFILPVCWWHTTLLLFLIFFKKENCTIQHHRILHGSFWYLSKGKMEGRFGRSEIAVKMDRLFLLRWCFWDSLLLALRRMGSCRDRTGSGEQSRSTCYSQRLCFPRGRLPKKGLFRKHNACSTQNSSIIGKTVLKTDFGRLQAFTRGVGSLKKRKIWDVSLASGCSNQPGHIVRGLQSNVCGAHGAIQEVVSWEPARAITIILRKFPVLWSHTWSGGLFGFSFLVRETELIREDQNTHRHGMFW